LLKTYRKNILDNKNWPNEPNSGWILPNNWYSRINDIIRTLFIVKYLDGVEYMINELGVYCEQCSILPETHFEAREEGYYAAHLYIRQNFEVPNIKWDTEIIDVSVEIQVTTQLQDVIRRLLHRYYEDSRKNFNRDEYWQWNYKSDEFSANYLGHILHYVEGMIVEIRDKEKSVEMK
jgi:ppGpp synthetase/RelA/SpoT-type nucleotidyltranferase